MEFSMRADIRGHGDRGLKATGDVAVANKWTTSNKV